MKTLFYVLSLLGGIAGTFVLVATFFATDASAVQQGAGAAVAIALVTIPYCMARAFEKLAQKPLEDSLGKLLIAQAQINRQAQDVARPDA